MRGGKWVLLWLEVVIASEVLPSTNKQSVSGRYIFWANHVPAIAHCPRRAYGDFPFMSVAFDSFKRLVGLTLQCLWAFENLEISANSFTTNAPGYHFSCYLVKLTWRHWIAQVNIMYLNESTCCHVYRRTRKRDSRMSMKCTEMRRLRADCILHVWANQT